MTFTSDVRPSADGAVTDLDPAALDRMLATAGDTPVLLDLWAPWCQPCLAQAPALDRLAAVTAGRLRVVKLDTQRHPEVAKALNVRGIPLLVVFRAGREVARRAGQQSFEQLCAWVDEVGGDDALVDTAAPAFRAPPPLDGAFHGDDGLRRFLVDRVVALAAEGGVLQSRFPVWAGDRGTVSCALVRHADLAVFSNVTGLPASFAICLHFAGVTSPESLTRVFDAVPAGADVRGVAPRLLLRWFGDDGLDWAGLLGDASDAVRRDWLRLCREQLDGEPPLPGDWDALRERAQALVSPDPYRTIANHFGRVIVHLSPPPPLEGANGWGPAMLSTGTYLVHCFSSQALGWTPAHYAFEVIRHNWYLAECPDPTGMSHDEMNALHARFEAAHRELVAETKVLHDRFFAELDQSAPRYHARLQSQLVEALIEARQG